VRLHPAWEVFDDDHASAAARTKGPRLRQFDRFCRLVDLRYRDQRTGAGDIGLAAGAHEHPSPCSSADTDFQWCEALQSPDGRDVAIAGLSATLSHVAGRPSLRGYIYVPILQ